MTDNFFRTGFDNLNNHTDYLKVQYEKAVKHEKYTIQQLIIMTLTDYYESLRAIAKFKHQRLYCMKVIFELNKPYAQGYFNKSKDLDHLDENIYK